jgi:hypothetical protein
MVVDRHITPSKSRVTRLESMSLSNATFIPMGGPQAHGNSLARWEMVWSVSRVRVFPHPAAGAEWLLEWRGRQAWIVVPRCGCDSMESVPFRSFSRSSILMRPRPGLFFARSGSKPDPESRTKRWISSDVPHNCTSNRCTPLCFAELWMASCRTR